ncbi:RDD family protein [Polaromonas sp.]|uniref:RDD family protein n=1 Tax=Polaromonas sp. TaxID=1869339 RepID=UPI002FC7FB73
MPYATFLRRLAAYGIDVALLLTIMVLLSKLTAANKALAMATTAVNGFAYVTYTFLLHGKCGQTLGKRLLRLRVLTSDFHRLSMVDSARRNLFFFACSLPWVVATLVAMSRLPASMYYAPRDRAYFVLEEQMLPDWYAYTDFALAGALALEIGAFIWTKRRQTLHDLIASTVVVHELATAPPTDGQIK